MISWKTVGQAPFSYYINDVRLTSFSLTSSTETFETTTVAANYTLTTSYTTAVTQTVAIAFPSVTTTTSTAETTVYTDTSSTSEQPTITNVGTETGVTTGSTFESGLSEYNQVGETINGATFNNALTNETSTTIEASYFLMVATTTDQGDEGPIYSLVPTTVSQTTTGSSESTTWTTAMTEATTTGLVDVESMVTVSILAATEGQTALGNVYDTIYLAAPQEVLAVAAYGKTNGQAADTATRATISHSAAFPPVMANTNSAVLSTASSVGSIEYRALASSSTTVLQNHGLNFGTNTGVYPILQDSAFESTMPSAVYSTVQSTATFGSSLANSIQHYGNTYSFAQTYGVFTKQRRFANESLEYDVLVEYFTTRPFFSAAGPFIGNVGESSGSTGGYSTYRTVSCGGIFAVEVGRNVPNVRTFIRRTQAPRRSIYRKLAAYLLNGDEGAAYDLEGQSVHVPVRLAQSVRGYGGLWNSQLFPQTNVTVTINSDSITWREATDAAASNYGSTHSATITVAGEPKTFLWNTDDVLGGTLQADEVAVESIPQGVWSNMVNSETSFYSLAEHSIVSNSEAAKSYLEPVPFCIYGAALPVIEVPAYDADYNIPGAPLGEL